MITDKDMIELQEYASMEGTEAGEGLEALMGLPRYYYCFSDEFVAAYQKELGRQLMNFRANYRWVEEEVKVPAKTEKVRRLEYIG